MLGAVLRGATQRIGRVDARVLLAHVLERPASYLVAHPEAALSEAVAGRFEALVQRREMGEPVAYLVGAREFYGRRFEVSPAVLIPRPDTELIIEQALASFERPPARVLDLGTGSGILAVSLALAWPSAQVVALDASVAALTVAAANARRLGARVSCVRSDWFAALAGEAPFELIVSNPPYVRAQDPHLSQGDLRFEPASALAAGADGLDDIRRIVAGAPAHLVAGGRLLMEHGYDQAGQVRTLLAEGGFAEVRSWRDLAGIERVTGGLLDAVRNDA